MVKNILFILVVFAFGCAKKDIPKEVAKEKPKEKKCTLVHDIYHGITKMNTQFMYGSMDQKGKLFLVYNDFIKDSLPLHKMKPRMFDKVKKWDTYASQFVKTDSGVWYNVYNADTAVLPDSLMKQSYFLYNYMIEAFYKMWVRGPLKEGELPDGIFVVDEKDFKVYPNPATLSFNIKMPKHMHGISTYDILFEMYNNKGVKVFSKKIVDDITKINIKNTRLKKGTYLYKILNLEKDKVLTTNRLVVY